MKDTIETLEFSAPALNDKDVRKGQRAVKRSNARYQKYRKALKQKNGYSTYNGKRVKVTKIATPGK